MNYKTEYEKYKRYYQTIEPNLEKPANRAYTAIIFSFLVVSLFGWYAIRPTMQTIFLLKREIKDKIQLNIQMENKISALIEAQAAYQGIETKIPMINQALPMIPDAVNLVAQLRKLSAQSHVTMIGINLPSLPIAEEATDPQKVDIAKKLAEYFITLSISGAYTDVKAYLQGIADMRRIVQIESMTFVPQRSAAVVTSEAESTESASFTPPPTSTNVQVGLKLKVFYLTK